MNFKKIYFSLIFIFNFLLSGYSQKKDVGDITFIDTNIVKKYFKIPDFVKCDKLCFDVSEVYEPYSACEKPFSYDFGSNFGYCGDVVGGIKNLLQTEKSSAIPHVRFENYPIENRKIYFYANGINVKSTKIMDTSIQNNPSHYLDARAIILKIMAAHFEFIVIEKDEYLDLLELRIVDSIKLNKLTSPIQDCIEEKGGHGYADSIPSIYISKCLPLWFLANSTETALNTYTVDMTGQPQNYYSYRMPRKYIEPNLTLEDLNNYLATNLGLKFFRREKAIKSKVYSIKFINGNK